jgi:hypothetical protein
MDIDNLAVTHIKKNKPPTAIESFVPYDRPYGLTFGQWTVKWWEWAFSVPVPINPVLDDTGQHGSINQNGPVWFLAGTIGDDKKAAHRICSIPTGKALLFPVINFIYTNEPKFKTDSDLVDHVTKDIDDIVIKQAAVDGTMIPIYRVPAEPQTFYLKVKEDNKMDIPIGISKAAADGYWVFLKPLAKGEHEIYFHGACSGGIRNATANYQITII